MKVNKTNAMRQLDAAGVKYEMCLYEVDESDLSGLPKIILGAEVKYYDSIRRMEELEQL